MDESIFPPRWLRRLWCSGWTSEIHGEGVKLVMIKPQRGLWWIVTQTVFWARGVRPPDKGAQTVWWSERMTFFGAPCPRGSGGTRSEVTFKLCCTVLIPLYLLLSLVSWQRPFFLTTQGWLSQRKKPWSPCCPLAWQVRLISALAGETFPLKLRGFVEAKLPICHRTNSGIVSGMT